MKTILLTLILVFSIIQAYPQCAQNAITFGSLGNILGVPDELNRKRLKFEDMRYGNPYTLIDRDAFPDANSYTLITPCYIL